MKKILEISEKTIKESKLLSDLEETISKYFPHQPFNWSWNNYVYYNKLKLYGCSGFELPPTYGSHHSNYVVHYSIELYFNRWRRPFILKDLNLRIGVNFSNFHSLYWNIQTIDGFKKLLKEYLNPWYLLEKYNIRDYVSRYKEWTI